DASLSEGVTVKAKLTMGRLPNASFWPHVTGAQIARRYIDMQTLSGPPTASNPLPAL
ncbi:hypothetical protein PHLCEN_2v6390, partial [Hermanssonia centrifuga]